MMATESTRPYWLTPQFPIAILVGAASYVLCELAWPQMYHSGQIWRFGFIVAPLLGLVMGLLLPSQAPWQARAIANLGFYIGCFSMILLLGDRFYPLDVAQDRWGLYVRIGYLGFIGAAFFGFAAEGGSRLNKYLREIFGIKQSRLRTKKS